MLGLGLVFPNRPCQRNDFASQHSLHIIGFTNQVLLDLQIAFPFFSFSSGLLSRPIKSFFVASSTSSTQPSYFAINILPQVLTPGGSSGQKHYSYVSRKDSYCRNHAIFWDLGREGRNAPILQAMDKAEKVNLESSVHDTIDTVLGRWMCSFLFIKRQDIAWEELK